MKTGFFDKRLVVGRWAEILKHYNILVNENPQKHTACPICGKGRNSHRFRFDNIDGRGTWICNQCGSGDGWKLLQIKTGMSFGELIDDVSKMLGYTNTHKLNYKKVNNAAFLNNIWKISKPISDNDEVFKYLQGRGICNNNILDLRFCPACYNSEKKRCFPAMVALFRNRNGKPVAIQRTYLSNGKKANVELPKKMTPATSSLSGGAIRLASVNDVLGVAEGVETALACMQMFNHPVWASTGATLMQAFEPPMTVKKLIIYGDNDRNYVGQSAAYILAKKMSSKMMVNVKICQETGDWLDFMNNMYGIG